MRNSRNLVWCSIVTVALVTQSSADALKPVPCGLSQNPIQARQCMLAQQIEDTRVAGSLGAMAGPMTLDQTLTLETRLANLRVRKKFSTYAAVGDERVEDDRLVLAPVGSGGNIGAFAPLLFLLLLFGLGGGSSGKPISPS